MYVKCGGCGESMYLCGCSLEGVTYKVPREHQNGSGRFVKWIYRCCVCDTVYETKEYLVPVDSHTIEIPPSPKEWKTDGLGGWMCLPCYKDWNIKRQERENEL